MKLWLRWNKSANDNESRKTKKGFSIKMARTLVHPLLVLLIIMAWAPSSLAQRPPADCPLNFGVLDQFPAVVERLKNNEDPQFQCATIDSALLAVVALYLRDTGFFLIPTGTSTACLKAYQAQLDRQGAGFNISICPVNAFFSERGTDLCQNIQTAQAFSSLVPASQLDGLNSSCSQTLEQETFCGLCSLALVSVTLSLQQNGNSNNASCSDFAKVYTMGVVNIPGPLDPSTVVCILYISTGSSGNRKKSFVYIGVGVAAMMFLCVLAAGFFYYRYRHIIAEKRRAHKKRTADMLQASSVPRSSINWYGIEDLKKATGNFSRDNLLGSGGYGNVYKGTLLDGSVVAVKMFKNCSRAGDANFVHEVEMISSVRHKNLVAIRGCCVDSSGVLDGNRRMIVYDYMPNGSLQDHLFPKTPGCVLDWPTRYKIAIGTARGLAYLHHDALPAIFHRDIKASNILLDTDFNARLADFGLAKFTPEGVSHLTTKVAGTYGYVAPEYALYGQLTEKSDVYSFGMVLLELVTGRKALSFAAEDPTTPLADWAWPSVKQGSWKTIVDPTMTQLGPDSMMERFILVALLCAHPVVFYRPSVDQALKMLENSSVAVPDVPDRPLPFTSTQTEIAEALSRDTQHHASSSGLGFCPIP